MKSFTKHTVLEEKLRHSFYVTSGLAVLAAVLGLISIFGPSELPDAAMMIPAALAVAVAWYGIGIKDADLTIYKSQNSEQAKEIPESNPN